MARFKTYFIVLLTAVLLGGCAASGKTDFSCAGPAPGVGCIPSTEVYEITNDPELQKAVTTALEAAAASGEEYDPNQVVAYVRATYQPEVEVTKPMAEPVKQPMPVLHPAHVIRIWFAAWEDQKGDLHMPGYVFTEITPRRWSFGEPEVSNSQILAPIQVDRSGESRP